MISLLCVPVIHTASVCDFLQTNHFIALMITYFTLSTCQWFIFPKTHTIPEGLGGLFWICAMSSVLVYCWEALYVSPPRFSSCGSLKVSNCSQHTLVWWCWSVTWLMLWLLAYCFILLTIIDFLQLFISIGKGWGEGKDTLLHVFSSLYAVHIYTVKYTICCYIFESMPA